ncbi:hypothetical protein D1336_21400 [Salmonella enterica subsp. enterica serovar Heidelberg]|nr:hypothetical protein [Salmonella enterica subsp. enterica serovar Heidelberg]
MNRKLTLVSASLVGALSLFSQTAKADDWGCQVLLCLSDPRGPTTESECKPPIHKLWDHLRKGKPFPTCDMAVNSRNGKRSYAKLVYDPYDPCPDGTKPAGGYIAQSQSTDRKDWRRLQYSFSTQGRRYVDDNYGYGPRACVGKYLGTYTVYRGGDDSNIPVQVYDQVVWQQPQNPRAIDVFIDEVFHHRVRY